MTEECAGRTNAPQPLPIPAATFRGHHHEENRARTYVIAEPSVDILDRACVEEWPVDCINEGAHALYIHPDEGVDWAPANPYAVEASYYKDDVRSTGRAG